MIKTVELLNLLDAPCGKNYSDKFDYAAICESIEKSMKYLSEKFRHYTGSPFDVGTVSDWQLIQAQSFFINLENEDIRNAYHSL